MHSLTPAQLADLELLLSGALAPLDRFLAPAEVESARATGRLPDGSPAPFPPQLTVPAEVAEEAAVAGALLLADPEGLPLARLAVVGRDVAPGGAVLSGPVRAVAAAVHGPFRSLRRTPAQVRAGLRAGRVTAVPVDRPLLAADLLALDELSARTYVLLLVRVADEVAGVPVDVLVRAAMAALRGRYRISVVAVPLRHMGDSDLDTRAVAAVAAAYGATDVEVLPDAACWPAARDALDSGMGRGEALAALPAPVLRELLRWRPPRSERGLTVFFTGLPGSGKSTLARALVDLLLQDGRRRVTVLDGDAVRRMLSAGLGFSRTDRDLNVRRIGWIAAEVGRHGGIAVCAPIAPYAATRAAVRRDVEAAGGDFVLVHVATPLEVCERRDPKGLYAKARAGLVPHFTGVSDAYEEPADADLVLDTSRLTTADAVQRIVALLTDGRWLPPT